MNTYGVDLMGRRHRRRHSDEFKASVIQECMRPGVSMAAVALAHGLNATMLRKWVTESERKGAPSRAPAAAEVPASPSFVPLALPAPAVEGEIRIELQRAGTAVKIVWPTSSAADCAAWLRDWLR